MVECILCKNNKEESACSVHARNIKEEICSCKEVKVCDGCFGLRLARGNADCPGCDENVIPKDYTSSEYVNYSGDDKQSVLTGSVYFLIQICLLFGWLYEHSLGVVLKKGWKVDLRPDIVKQLNEAEQSPLPLK